MQPVARMERSAIRGRSRRVQESRITLSLHPGFCNGPWLVNPFLRHPLAGNLLLYGINAMVV
ncbi:hypothetical protein, partial [Bradyrhizobium sp. 139]|uniref:hypothetical protein n=1 Tax=Bradyrhizobium sp. 139 TaxID=2782616 RepID=UPI001FF8EA8C